MDDQTTSRPVMAAGRPRDNLGRYEILCLITDHFKTNRRPHGAAKFAAAVGWAVKLATVRLDRAAALGFLNRSVRKNGVIYWHKPVLKLEIADVR